MVSCAIFGCNHSGRNASNLRIRFFSFPKDAEYAKKWVHACKRSDKFNIKYARICSIHFTQEDYHTPLIYSMLNYSPKNRRCLKDTAIPSQNLPNKLITDNNVVKKTSERDYRKIKRNQTKAATDLLKRFNENAKQKLNVNDNNLNYEVERSSIIEDVTPIFEPQIISKPENDVSIKKDMVIKKLEKQLYQIKALQSKNKIIQLAKFRRLQNENLILKKEIALLKAKYANVKRQKDSHKHRL